MTGQKPNIGGTVEGSACWLPSSSLSTNRVGSPPANTAPHSNCSTPTGSAAVLSWSDVDRVSVELFSPGGNRRARLMTVENLGDKPNSETASVSFLNLFGREQDRNGKQPIDALASLTAWKGSASFYLCEVGSMSDGEPHTMPGIIAQTRAPHLEEGGPYLAVMGPELADIRFEVPKSAAGLTSEFVNEVRRAAKRVPKYYTAEVLSEAAMTIDDHLQQLRREAEDDELPGA